VVEEGAIECWYGNLTCATGRPRELIRQQSNNRTTMNRPVILVFSKRSGGSSLGFVLMILHLYNVFWSLVLVRWQVSSLLFQYSTTLNRRWKQIDASVPHSVKYMSSVGRMSHPSQTFAAALHTQGDETFRDEKWKERAKHWVILVDDEESIRHAVGDFLFDQGYQVTACSDADTMFQVIFNKTGVPDSVRKSNNVTNEELSVNIPAIPDIIISDVRMPGKNGIQMTEIIRGNERLRRVPIVLLTAKALTQDRVAGYRAGADVYLPKPFSPEELLSIIDGVILRRRQRAGERGKMADLAEELSYVKQILQLDTGRYTLDKHRDSAPSDNHFLQPHIRLTPREQEVLELLAMGYTNSEIAAARGVSVVAVNRTIQALYRKTDTHTRKELLRWGIQRGQLPNP